MNTSFQTASEQSPGRFENAQGLFGHLDANVISNLITTTADVVLVMDENGLIEDAAFAEGLKQRRSAKTTAGSRVFCLIFRRLFRLCLYLISCWRYIGLCHT
jgi:hypothetical protein